VDLECFDRQGKEISRAEWEALYTMPGYQRVAATKLPDGRYVSTVWLGLDHQFEEFDQPLIFETMVFPAHPEPVPDDMPMDEFIEQYVVNPPNRWRYTTEVQALAGHEAVVAQLRGPTTLTDLLGEVVDG
jgi:hypothetical protein